MPGLKWMLVAALVLAACSEPPSNGPPPIPAEDTSDNAAAGDTSTAMADAPTGPDGTPPCQSAQDCADGDPCNGAEICDPTQGCVPGEPLICDDGDLCNGVESCTPDLGCQPGVALACDDGDVCNGAETCDPKQGCQSGEALACDDGDVCNGAETCDPKQGCQSGEALACDDGDVCNGAETCDPEQGCLSGEVLACDDGDVCNGAETCDPAIGCIEGQPLICDDQDACNGAETCDPALGCLKGQSPICDDGDACNGVETCDPLMGCELGLPPACDDGDACNGVETCGAALGCIAGVALQCDDGDACDGVESCEPAAGCVAGLPLECDDGLPCNGVETCDVATGCVQGTPPAGCCTQDAECDDQNLCNGVETCQADTATCALGESVQCDNGDACDGVETCDPALGCQAASPPDCDDGDACNGVETCQSDVGCVPGAALSCDDEEPCNGVETCDAEAGCVAGQPLWCDDGEPCNGAETCELGVGCQSGEPLQCDDQDACNGVETCQVGAGCKPGSPPQCDNGDACDGVETCAPEAGCLAGVAPQCDDGMPCNGVETCDPALGCVAGLPPLGCCDSDADCDDALWCNGLETCDLGQHTCAVGTPPVCDDGDVCNGLETCDDDADGCAAGLALECDDQNPCTDDSCDAGAGCLTANNLADCSDGDPCTVQDHCTAGACVPGAPRDCDDGDGCTIDLCDALEDPQGCYHAPDKTPAIIAISGLEPGSVVAKDVTLTVAVTGANVASTTTVLDGAAYVSGTPITAEGPHLLVVTAADCGGKPTLAQRSFVIDKTPPSLSVVTDPLPNAAGWNNSPVTVSFVASDAGSAVVSVTDPVLVKTPGLGIEVSGQAVDEAGNVGTITATVNLDMKAPVVVLTAPIPNLTLNDMHVVGEPEVVFEGIFNDDALSGFEAGLITSSKLEAHFTFASAGPYQATIPLLPGVNTVIVAGRDVAGNTGTASVCVIYDEDSPHVFIQSPPNDSQTVEVTVDVSGLAHDLVVGGITAEDVVVTVNGVAATVDNGHFVALAVPLSLGTNTLVATAIDAVGHGATHQITVTRLSGANPHLEVVSGDHQEGEVKAALAAPMVVRLVDELGLPVPGQEIAFAVTDNDGTLDSTAATLKSPKGRAVIVESDAEGLASATLTLGSHAGAGTNRVTVSASTAVASVSLHASGLPKAPVDIHVHSGANQVGATGKPLPMPLAVVVSDAQGNPVEGSPVTFAVLEGGGKFASGSALTVLSNANGFADVVFVPSELEGPGRHRVRASIGGSQDEESGTQLGVVFSATAWREGDPALTSIHGRVLDENEAPIEGVRLAIHSQGQTAEIETFSNSNGEFDLEGVSPGYGRLEIDGMAAVKPTDPFKLPHLYNEITCVAGIVNTIDRPIYLLHLNHGQWADGLTEVRLTLPEVPGFELRVPAGTKLTFPDGSHEGELSVTQVHFDQAPMAPLDGLNTRLLVTIQPPGVRFDPPAPLQIANVDGYPPGRKVEMFSYDHDLETFIAIGTGSVSEDGSVIRSDPGVGVVKGGWHCGSNPQAAGGCDDDDDCQATGTCDCKVSGMCECSSAADCADQDLCNGTETCTNGTCVAGTAPDCDDQNPCTADKCQADIGCYHEEVPDCDCTAKLTVTGGGGKTADLLASGVKAEGGTWSFESECDDLQVIPSDGPCDGKSTCPAQVVVIGGGVAARGTVKVTHHCPGGKTASAVAHIKLCDGGNQVQSAQLSVLPLEAIQDALNLVTGKVCAGTKLFTFKNVTAAIQTQSACCDDCAAVGVKKNFEAVFPLQVNLTCPVGPNTASIKKLTSWVLKWVGKLDSVPYFPEIGFDVTVQLDGKAKVGIKTDTCCGPACTTTFGGGSLGLRIKGSGKLFVLKKKLLDSTYTLAEASASLSSAINGTLTVSPGKICDKLCWSGIQADVKLAFMNGALFPTYNPNFTVICPSTWQAKCWPLGDIVPPEAIGPEKGLCGPSNYGCDGPPPTTPVSPAAPPDFGPDTCAKTDMNIFGQPCSDTPPGCQSDEECDNHDPCDGAEACAAGSCVSGLPIDCDDQKSCTVDTCQAGTGCVHTPDGAACPATGVACATASCAPESAGADPETGCLVSTQDTLCADAFACTQDTCVAPDASAGEAGGCIHVPATGYVAACDDHIGCTVDTCDPAAAAGCAHSPNDAACADGYACTADSCDPTNPKALTSGALRGCVRLPQHAACADGLACNGTETCAPPSADPSGCQAGVPLPGGCGGGAP